MKKRKWILILCVSLICIGAAAGITYLVRTSGQEAASDELREPSSASKKQSQDSSVKSDAKSDTAATSDTGPDSSSGGDTTGTGTADADTDTDEAADAGAKTDGTANPDAKAAEVDASSAAHESDPADTDTPDAVSYITLQEVQSGAPQEVLAGRTPDPAALSSYAAAYPIDEGIFARINGKSYRENDDIAPEDLRYVKVLHYNFDHQLQIGELIVNTEIADKICAIFSRLLKAEYEIESLRLVDDYWTGDPNTTDDASMLANNSAAFNYRTIYGTDKLSNHAKGYAVDINPAQNPYVIFTAEGYEKPYDFDETYLNRDSGLPHVITHDDACYQAFTQEGFTWGGDWDNPKDYQHFEYLQ